MSTFQDIPTNLIIGFLGVGKTTAVKHLLSQRPAHQRWAVLVNEFGQVGVDGALLDEDGVALKEIPGGCLCCVGSQSLAVGLNRLIKEANPDRILIEPTGLGHPAQLLETLTTGYYDNVLDVRATVGLLDARQLADPRYRDHESFTDQMHLADVLLANKADTYTEADRLAFMEVVRDADPAKSQTAFIEHGRIDVAWLDLPRSTARHALFPEAHAFLKAHHHEHAHHDHAHDHSHDEDHTELPQDWLMVTGAADGFYSAGWLLDKRFVFDAAALRAWCEALRVTRCKGVLHTDQEWLAINAVQSDCDVAVTQALTVSRLEIIADSQQDWSLLDQQLRGLIKKPV